MIWPSGSASAAAGIIPQASAAARPRVKSETARFSLMVVLLLSQAGARPSGAQNRCRPVSIPWPNIPLRPVSRNPEWVSRGWRRRRGRGREAAGPLLPIRLRLLVELGEQVGVKGGGLLLGRRLRLHHQLLRFGELVGLRLGPGERFEYVRQ